MKRGSRGRSPGGPNFVKSKIYQPSILRQFVETNSKLVSRKESARYPGLFVLKYKRKVFYDNLWNDILEECRGLVVDKDYNVVVHPFTKIYNRFENDSDMNRDDIVTISRKINGFMATVTPYKAQAIVSTTGSLDSDYVDMAKEMIPDDFLNAILPNLSYIFEIVHPNDPHIISEECGCYLIGIRDLATGVLMDESFLNNTFLELKKYGDFKRDVDTHNLRFSDVVSLVKTIKHEGFVVRRMSDDYILKIKSPYYLITKFLGRMNPSRLIKLLDEPVGYHNQIVDEEFYQLIDYLRLNKDLFISSEEQEKIKIIRNYLSNGTSGDIEGVHFTGYNMFAKSS